MQAVAALSVVWLAAVFVFVGLMVYRSHLDRHETEELFLDDLADSSFRKQEHDRLVRRVNFIHPYYRGMGGVTLLLTGLVVGAAVLQILPYVRV